MGERDLLITLRDTDFIEKCFIMTLATLPLP